MEENVQGVILQETQFKTASGMSLDIGLSAPSERRRQRP